jgi:malonyl-CoA/methylmalonyl-CoA synthetase
MPTSIVEAFLNTARTDPNRLFLIFEGKSYTYGQMLEKVNIFAISLQKWGLQKSDRLALFLDNSPEFIAAYLGTGLAGGIVVLVNTQYRQVELRHILSDAGVRLCLTDAPRRAELARIEAELDTLETVIILDPADNLNQRDKSLKTFLEFFGITHPVTSADLIPPPSPDEVAIIGYTSGTTGRAKGAMLTHGNIAANAKAVIEAWHWTQDDHLLLTLPLFHAHGLGVGTNGTIMAGASMDLRPHFEVEDVYQALLGKNVIKPPTMFFGVPTMYGRLLAEAQKQPERPKPLRLYVSGSAPLNPQTFEDFQMVFGQTILERYGMTETFMNLTNPYEKERRAGTVGLPFPRQEARVVDVISRQPVADGETGEIEVRGAHVFKGYWNRPEATAEAFTSDGWFKTGDLGWCSADGYYTISGRAKELIISGGYNIYPREVEEVLLAHPKIAEVAVVGLPDPDFGEQVVAAIVPRDPSLTPEEVIVFCKDSLASYKKPRQIFFLRELPRNALTKVQKHLIVEQILQKK